MSVRNRSIEMRTDFIIIFFAMLPFFVVDAKVYRRCELAKELLVKYKFSRTFLTNWVCLAEAESGLDTGKLSFYPPLYKKYGIFQINSKNYCRSNYPGGLCKIRCEDLLTENIKRSADCAKLIFEHDGFKAWDGWMSKCKQKPLPNLSNCNL